MEELDRMLDAINLPEDINSEDCMLTLHSSFEKILIEANKDIFPINEHNTIKKYRGFLLWFDPNIQKKLCFICFIDNEIEYLRNLQSNKGRWFSSEEYNKLKYLLSSKQKADT